MCPDANGLFDSMSARKFAEPRRYTACKTEFLFSQHLFISKDIEHKSLDFNPLVLLIYSSLLRCCETKHHSGVFDRYINVYETRKILQGPNIARRAALMH
jgi:hypothetical protein